MKVKFKHNKNFMKGVEDYLKKGISTNKMKTILSDIGESGLDMLSDETPVDSGITAESWHYEIIEERKTAMKLCFYNNNEVDGVNIAMLLQYGHGTRNGGYVPGEDYINPVLSDLADDLASAVTKEAKFNGSSNR